MIPRLLAPHVQKLTGEWGKIALISGPRQVGKTTLARQVLAEAGQGVLLNWDIVDDQKRFLSAPYFYDAIDREPAQPFVVALDEFHKYAPWKNWLKGAYDRDAERVRFVLTGSGRLDLFRKGADSLLGRALRVPLLPLTLGELAGRLPTPDEVWASAISPPPAQATDRDALDALLRLGGFPEPFVRGDVAFHRAWYQERKQMLVRQDLRDATRIREISLVEVLSHLLPARVGSPLSVNSLRGDLGVAFETVRDWLAALEQFYYLFRVTPFSRNVARSLTKEPKVYLYDPVEVVDPGPRFENLVALHLQKAVETWSALGLADASLHYVRDKEKREVDFLVIEAGAPRLLVECKLSDPDVSPTLRHFQQVLDVPLAVQVVRAPGACRVARDEAGRTLAVLSADRWLGQVA